MKHKQVRRQRKSNMTLVIMLVLAIAIAAVLLLWNPQSATAATLTSQPDTSQELMDATLVKVGDKAPDFKVDMFDGERVRLSDLRGKVVLVTFWATWCPPCREELRYAQTDLIDRFKDKPFVFLPISRGEDYSTVAAFRKRMGYTFPMGLDTDRFVYSKFATNGIPRNFLIDAEGRVTALTIGFDKAEFAELVKAIDKLLSNK